jgi:hypothetical protein
MRRVLLAVATMIGTTLLGAGSSRAQYSAYGEGRYCAVVSSGLGSVSEICNFNDFETCRLEVVSGNRGFCNDNPRWIATHGGYPGTGQPALHRTKRKHRRH